MKCRITRETLVPVMDLGNHYVSDFVDKKDILKGDVFPLQVGFGQESGLAQLFSSYPPSKMYRKYWYKSGVNDSMRSELKNIVESTKRFIHVSPGQTVLDIASNDGTLLTNWPRDVKRVGVDPSDVAKDSEIYAKEDIALVNDFFSARAYHSVTNAKAKVVTLIAMFYDLDEPLRILKEIHTVIDSKGLLVLQMSYTPLMLRQNAFDNIGHEHLCYYTLKPLETLLNNAGFKIVDVELNDTNGGSFRVYSTPCGKAMDPYDNFSSPAFVNEIAKARHQSIVAYEKAGRWDTPEPWWDFAQRVDVIKETTIKSLKAIRSQGKRVIGYGASTKGNTLLQHFGITPDLLPAIAERSEAKWGKYTVGTGIPIISEAEMRAHKPDYLFVLPWHFIDNFRDREKELFRQGTAMIVPLPQFRTYYD